MGNMYETICSLCESRGIKPGTLCRELGISRSILTEMKAGRTKSLSAKNSKLIADYFGVSTDRLLGEKEKPTTDDGDELAEYLEALKSRPEMRMLFQLSKDATVEEVKEAVRIIEAIRQKD